MRTLRPARPAVLRPLVGRRLAAGAAGLVLIAGAVACSGGSEGGGDPDASPQERLELSKERLDETSGVRLSLATSDSIDVDAFLTSAEGVITADPAAFEGTVAGTFQGLSASDLRVVSVDGEVQVELPGVGLQTIDPAGLCAPDPAALLDPDSGFSPVLTAATDLEAGESERGGPDNAEVLTPISGTVPGEVVRNVIPCAPGEEFTARFTLNEDDELRSAEITGEFYSGSEATYVLDVEEYDVEGQIDAP